MYRPYRSGLRDALPLQLTIDSPSQVVGGKPTFTLIGAPPGATVLWSSYKDGQATGEFNSSYGQMVEANGTARLVGGDWATGDVGTWIKEVLVQTPEGANQRAVVQFQVRNAPATIPPGAPGSPAIPTPAGGDFFSKTLFSIGSFHVTGGLALAAGAALYFLSGKKR